jgi:hypothetical protein
VMPRHSLHRGYLKVLLEWEVGSAYSALEEREFEGRCMRLSPEELLEIISRRGSSGSCLKRCLLTPLGSTRTFAPSYRSW